MIPENEKWLYENPEALKSVLQGMKEVSEGKFADFTPDLEKDSGMLEILERLKTVIKEESISTWLDTPNPAFNGRKPQELLNNCEFDELWKMIHFLESGEPS